MQRSSSWTGSPGSHGNLCWRVSSNKSIFNKISGDRPDLIKLGDFAGSYGFVMNGGTSASVQSTPTSWAVRILVWNQVLGRGLQPPAREWLSFSSKLSSIFLPEIQSSMQVAVRRNSGWQLRSPSFFWWCSGFPCCWTCSQCSGNFWGTSSLHAFRVWKLFWNSARSHLLGCPRILLKIWTHCFTGTADPSLFLAIYLEPLLSSSQLMALLMAPMMVAPALIGWCIDWSCMSLWVIPYYLWSGWGIVLPFSEPKMRFWHWSPLKFSNGPPSHY